MSELDKYGSVITHATCILQEDMPGIYRSSFDIENFYFTNRLDTYAVVEPGVRALLVDCGDPRLVGRDFIDRLVTDFGIPWNCIEIFVTHFHDDHDGNVLYALEQGAKAVYVGEYIPYSDDLVRTWLTASGAEEHNDTGIWGETSYLMGNLPPENDYLDQATVVPAGHVFHIAGYNLEVIFTPGHTGSHYCLMDKAAGVLFAGDHLLDSAPGLMSYYLDEHLLGNWLDNLRFLMTCHLKKIYMCHADSIVGEETINQFLQRQIDKYDKPLGKVTNLMKELADQPKTAYDVAERYYDRLPGGLAAQPNQLRGRRVSIIYGYLEYLTEQGVMERTTDNGKLLYQLRAI